MDACGKVSVIVRAALGSEFNWGAVWLRRAGVILPLTFCPCPLVLFFGASPHLKWTTSVYFWTYWSMSIVTRRSLCPTRNPPWGAPMWHLHTSQCVTGTSSSEMADCKSCPLPEENRLWPKESLWWDSIQFQFISIIIQSVMNAIKYKHPLGWTGGKCFLRTYLTTTLFLLEGWFWNVQIFIFVSTRTHGKDYGGLKRWSLMTQCTLNLQWLYNHTCVESTGAGLLC